MFQMPGDLPEFMSTFTLLASHSARQVDQSQSSISAELTFSQAALETSKWLLAGCSVMCSGKLFLSWQIWLQLSVLPCIRQRWLFYITVAFLSLLFCISHKGSGRFWKLYLYLYFCCTIGTRCFDKCIAFSCFIPIIVKIQLISVENSGQQLSPPEIDQTWICFFITSFGF